MCSLTELLWRARETERQRETEEERRGPRAEGVLGRQGPVPPSLRAAATASSASRRQELPRCVCWGQASSSEGDRPGKEEDAVLDALAFRGGLGRDPSHRQACGDGQGTECLMLPGRVAKLTASSTNGRTCVLQCPGQVRCSRLRLWGQWCEPLHTFRSVWAQLSPGAGGGLEPALLAQHVCAEHTEMAVHEVAFEWLWSPCSEPRAQPQGGPFRGRCCAGHPAAPLGAHLTPRDFRPPCFTVRC